jgi:hypothetical protein
VWNSKTDAAKEARVMDWQYQAGEREAARKVALEFNKKLKEVYAKGMAVLQNGFEGSCNAATVLTNAIVTTDSARANFYAMMDAMVEAFEPNTTVDAMKWRVAIGELTDVGMSHHEWEAKFQGYLAKLTKLKAMPTILELNQIVIKNVKNPAFAMLKTNLMLDTAKAYDDDEDRMYTYHEFRANALTLSGQDTAIDDWGTKGNQTAMYSSDSTKQGAFVGCYRCGGDHQVHTCVAKTCTKCHAKIVDDTGDKVRHEARYCTSGGAPPGKRFSKGGDKDKDKGKAKGSWGGKSKESSKSSSGGATESLPDPTNFKSKQLKAYLSKITSVIEERAGTAKSSKKMSRDEWEAEVANG